MSEKKRGRRIVVDDKPYQWRTCVGGAVIWDADDKQHKATVRELTGHDSPANSDPVPILPSYIADWIRTQLHRV